MKKFFLYLFVFNLFTFFVYGATKKSDSSLIKNVNIVGNERVDNTIILNYLKIEENKLYTSNDINNFLKILYETGLFKEVNVDFNNQILTINLIENPLVIEIGFDGNKKIDDDILMSEIRTLKRSIFNKNKISSDIKRILDIYRRSGRFLATVDAKMIETEGNRVKIVFEINEGNPAKIKNIYFVGNNNFSGKTLKDKIQSKESKYLRFSSDEIYDPLRVEFDKELIRRYYYSKGYPDFEVLSATGEVDKNYKWFNITFLLNEGEKYKFGEIKITNKIEKVDEKKLNKKIKIKSGKWFNGNLLNATIDELTKELAKDGFMFTNIHPITSKNEEMKTIDVNFLIEETPRYYVGKIKITGNTRTYDNIIRQELRFGEGDIFNLTNFNRSIQRIRNLGFFDKVDAQQSKGDEENQIDITIDVTERKTGEISFGIGYSTLDGASINMGIKENNLYGTAQMLSFNTTISEYTKSLSFNYGKPYFLGRDLYGSFGLFYIKNEDEYSVEYEEKSWGGTVSGSYSITEYLDQKIFYSAMKQQISNVDDDYYNLIDEGTTTTFILGQTLYYDRVDNKNDPSKGFNLYWTIQYAMNDKKYIKNTGGGNLYIPIIPDYLTFKFAFNGGSIRGRNKYTITLTDGFYIGSTDLRGFKYGGVGPRLYNRYTGEVKDGNSAGAMRYYIYDFELKFPLGLPREYGIYGALFYNAGTATHVEDKYKSYLEDSGKIRSACGLSILWQSPMGPISFDFSKILKHEEYDETQNFAFNFGTTF